LDGAIGEASCGASGFTTSRKWPDLCQQSVVRYFLGRGGLLHRTRLIEWRNRRRDLRLAHLLQSAEFCRLVRILCAHALILEPGLRPPRPSAFPVIARSGGLQSTGRGAWLIHTPSSAWNSRTVLKTRSSAQSRVWGLFPGRARLTPAQILRDRFLRAIFGPDVVDTKNGPRDDDDASSFTYLEKLERGASASSS